MVYKSDEWLTLISESHTQISSSIFIFVRVIFTCDVQRYGPTLFLSMQLSAASNISLISQPNWFLKVFLGLNQPTDVNEYLPGAIEIAK